MHRNKLLNLLKDYSEKYHDEKYIIDRFITFIRNNQNCFERSLEHGHITASAWVMDNELKNVLLTHHKKLDKWLQLGGHVDGKSDVLKEAIREVNEESGLISLELKSDGIFDLDVHLIPSHKNESEHFHYDVRFLFISDEPSKISISDESNDLKWISIKQIKQYTTEPSILRMSKKIVL